MTTVVAVADLVAGRGIALTGVFTVGPGLAAAAGSRRQVVAVGAYSLALAVVLSPYDRIWFTRELAFDLLAIALTTVAGVLVSGRLNAAQSGAVGALSRASRLAAIVEQSADAIISKDLDGIITSWNDGAHRLYGYPADEALGQHLSLIIPPERSDELAGNLARIRAGEHVAHYETVRMCRDGTRKDVSVTVSPLVDDTGAATEATEIGRDITKRLATEAERDRLDRRIQQIERLDSLGQLAGGIAHDFNNMLAVILNYATLLQRQVTDESLLNDIQAITTSAQRAAALTNQLLAFSSPTPTPETVVDVNQVVRSLTGLLGRTLPANIRLVTHLSDDAWHVRTDVTRVEQILMNLALNARDAMPDGGTLTIETTNDTIDELVTGTSASLVGGRYLRIAVSDTGIGMTPDVRDRAFEPFFTTKPRGQGTGLGLATVYGILRLAAGGATIYSEPGSGTTVRVHVPADNGGLSAAAAHDTALSHALGAGERILVVEDEELLRDALIRVLEGAGYTVAATATAEAALELAEGDSSRFELLITDVILPGMSGPDLAGQLCARDPLLPVLYMSGYTAHTLDFKPEDAAYRLIEKPFSLETFLRRVAESLAAGRSRQVH